MVFYQKVRVAADPNTLVSLIRICGPDSLLYALDNGFLELCYIENHLGVSNTATPRGDRYGLVLIGPPPRLSVEQYARTTFFELTGKQGRSTRLANRLSRHVDRVKWNMTDAQKAKAEILVPGFVSKCVDAVLEHFVPGFSPQQGSFFNVYEDPPAAGSDASGAPHDLVVETNFDLRRATGVRRQIVSDSTVTPASLLMEVFDALAGLRLSAAISADMAVSPSTTAVASVRFSELLQLRAQNHKQLSVFQEWTCHEGRGIAEAVRSGSRNFDDVLRLTEESKKLKGWLAPKSEDADLLKEYVREISRTGWADKLPCKTVRMLLFAGAGAIISHFTSEVAGVMGSLGLGITDSLLLDKLVKGWKPNQFVEGSLRPFVGL